MTKSVRRTSGVIRNEAAVLRDILRGTATVTGHAFFTALVESLSQAVGARVAWVTEFVEQDGDLNALALVTDNGLQTNHRYPLRGTPCETVIRRAKLVHHSDDVQVEYPDDPWLKKLGLRSYFGVPLLDVDGTVLGHLAVMDKDPMTDDLTVLPILQIFAARAAAELQRLRSEKEQQQLKALLQQANKALQESEQRFRDLFEEAPIAYVHEDLDSRFLRANRTATQILGITPDEVTGMYGKSLVPDTPEAQARVSKALASVGRGENPSGLILELERKDNGKPVWIQWWSSPAPDGSYTRTMFIDITEQVLTARRNEVLEAQNTYLQEELRQTHSNDFIGDSDAMQRVFEDLNQVAATDATVLLLGETGTGKELAARAIHAASTRSRMPLIKVNCGALPAALIESELFGHEKGAFTGATRARDGRFALADGGTIFLDEIGEIPIDLQVKLLRVLQEGEMERLGSSKPRTVNVRVIAATNRNLLEAIDNGEFREDLYYRLAVFPVEMPPLRARGDDVVKLANSFALRYAESIGKTVAPLSARAAERLKAYRWPGNVREVQNVIERAVITSVDGSLNLDRALPESASRSSSEQPRVRTVAEMRQIERDNIVMALESSDWIVGGEDGAAQLLGMNASTLSSRIKALGIKKAT